MELNKKLEIVNSKIESENGRLMIYNFEIELVLYERFNGEFFIHNINWIDKDNICFTDGNYIEDKEDAKKIFLQRENQKRISILN